MRTRPRLSLALLALHLFAGVAGAGLVGACSNQGEGEVCNQAADDCQSQYQCVPVTGNGYRCCPIPPAQPSANSICAPNNPGVNDANVPPSEDGPTADTDGETEAASTVDAAGEGSSSAETSTDAPTSVESGSGSDGNAATDAAGQ
jgi:hypothetical protein